MAFPLGVITDSNIDYLLKRHYFYPLDFVTGIATINLGGGGGPATLTAGFANSNAAPINLLQIGGTRRHALQISTVAATLSATWSPSDFDNRWPVYVRYHWSSSAGTAVVATFNTFWSGGTVDTVTATPSTALTRVAPSQAKAAAAYSRALTGWGYIGALATGPFAFHTVPATVDEIAFNISLSTVSGPAVGTIPVWLYKVELAYTPRLTFGDGSGREARYMNEILAIGPQEAGPTVHI
jgi:hypothetical protein